MSMRGRVIGGTPRFDEQSKCETCRWAIIIQGTSSRERIVTCQQLYPHQRIPFHVTNCNTYLERSKISYDEMKKTAWIVDKNARGTVGFLKPWEVCWNRDGEAEKKND